MSYSATWTLWGRTSTAPLKELESPWRSKNTSREISRDDQGPSRQTWSKDPHEDTSPCASDPQSQIDFFWQFCQNSEKQSSSSLVQARWYFIWGCVRIPAWIFCQLLFLTDFFFTSQKLKRKTQVSSTNRWEQARGKCLSYLFACWVHGCRILL